MPTHALTHSRSGLINMPDGVQVLRSSLTQSFLCMFDGNQPTRCEQEQVTELGVPLHLSVCVLETPGSCETP